MNESRWAEHRQEMLVTYTLEIEGHLIAIENVPASINLETGERMFSPETVEHLRKIISKLHTPDRIIRVPVYQFD